MAATLTQPPRHADSERLRRRRDRHARLATDRALTEVAFMLRAATARNAASISASGHELDVHRPIRAPERASQHRWPRRSTARRTLVTR